MFALLRTYLERLRALFISRRLDEEFRLTPCSLFHNRTALLLVPGQNAPVTGMAHRPTSNLLRASPPGA